MIRQTAAFALLALLLMGCYAPLRPREVKVTVEVTMPPEQAVVVLTSTPQPTYTPYPTYTAMPTATKTPPPTLTPWPTDTLSPTRTPEPSPTPTVTNTPRPTSTPTSTRNPILNEIEQYLASEILGDNTSVLDVQIQEEWVTIVIDSQGMSLGQKLQGIRLLHNIEQIIYLCIYECFREFPTIGGIKLIVVLDGKQAYTAEATRETAHSFFPWTFRVDVSQIDPLMLVVTAEEQYMIRKFHPQMLHEALARSVQQPTIEDIEGELRRWIWGEMEISMADGNVALVSNLSESVVGTNVAKEAGLEIVNSMYALFSRFPVVKKVTVNVIVDGRTYISRSCTIEQFESMGAAMFERAGAESEPTEILKQLSIP